ncbi:MAG: RloB domain-containing protein [Treponema sp.]|nr:RloB domain-containing protein [Treponema sp.]
MIQRLQNNTYYFSVEGETEVLYFQHLQRLIRSVENRKANPVIRVERIKPSSFSKKISILKPCSIVAVYDVEDNDIEQRKRFEGILKDMKAAEGLGKSIKFELGYSNIDFELWILLHKVDLFGTIGNKKQYLPHINKVFGIKFDGLKEYKEEKNFLKILSAITLDDVKRAVQRAEAIVKQRKAEGKSVKICGYEWFEKNPSLSIHESVKRILKECLA